MKNIELGVVIIIAAVVAYFFIYKESYKPPKGNRYNMLKGLGKGIQHTPPKISNDETRVVEVGSLWQKDWVKRPYWYVHERSKPKVI